MESHPYRLCLKKKPPNLRYQYFYYISFRKINQFDFIKIHFAENCHLRNVSFAFKRIFLFFQDVLNDGSFIEDSPFENSVDEEEEEIICDMKMQKTKTVSISFFCAK